MISESENIDFDSLYESLKDADSETLLAVTKRAISTGQFLPHWFTQRYMVSTLLAVTKRAISTGQFLPHWFI